MPLSAGARPTCLPRATAHHGRLDLITLVIKSWVVLSLLSYALPIVIVIGDLSRVKEIIYIA